MRQHLVSLIIATTFSTPLFAQTAEDLAALSRGDFLKEYEDRFVAAVLTQQELLARVSPEFGDIIDVGPVTDAEREGIACHYDVLDERDQVLMLSQQLITNEILQQKVESDPDFDMISTVFDQEFLESFADQVPDEALDAMIECDLMSLTSQRMAMTPEIWATLGQIAQERGYVDD